MSSWHINRLWKRAIKIIERADATGSLSAYASEIDKGVVIVTNQGKPVAALVPLDNADLETVALGTNRQFLELIERSRARVAAQGGISSEEMRKRFAKDQELQPES